MSRRLVLITAIILAIGVGYYVWAGQTAEVCTVCLAFEGRSRCATKAGKTGAEAAERARRTACEEATPTENGRAKCFQSPPTSVQCKTR